MLLEELSNIADNLAAMPDQALQSYAAMHKEDPYIMALAVSESNRRKAARASQAPQVQPEPTVADEEIAEMDSAAADMGGIAALPAPNMEMMAAADGGIVGGMDDGYDMAVGYADGGMVERYQSGGRLRQYEELIRQEAKRQGVNPDLAVRLFMTESGGDPNAVSPKGAVGLGQLMPAAAKEMGIDPKERTDPEKNIRASIGYFKKLKDKYGSDETAAAAYNWGPGSVDKHIARNEGKFTRAGLPKETADYLTKLMPVGTAQAATPQQSAPATPAEGAQPPGYLSQFGAGLASLADVALSPAAFAVKQVGYAASRPFLSPEEAEKFSGEAAAPFQDAVGKLFGVTNNPAYQQEASRRLMGFVGENLDKGSKWIANKLGIPEQDAANMVNTLAAAGPSAIPSARGVAKAGEAAYAKLRPETGKYTPQQLAQMTEQARAAEIAKTKREAMEAGATLEEQAALGSMVSERQRAEAPSAAYEIQQAAAGKKPGRISAGTTKLGETASKVVPYAGEGSPSTTPEDDGSYDRAETKKFITQAESARAAAANLSEQQKEIIGRAAEEVVPDSDKYSPEDLILLGLNLMASQNRSFLGALGEAGRNVIAEKRARKKEQREEDYRKAVTERTKAETSYIKGGKGGSGRALKDILGGVDRAANRAQRIATAQWGQMADRQELIKQGFKTFDQYYSHLLRQEQKRALPISGVSTVDDEED